MSETRTPLGSLASAANEKGADALRRRVEQTPLQRHINHMYQRREEAWRGLTRERVAAFLRLFVLCFVELENGVPLETATYRMLKKKLVKGVIPWIHFRLVYTMEERWWPITLAQFREVNAFLADHLPRVHKEDQWDAIRYFYEEVVRQRDELKRLEEMEREAMKAVRRCLNSWTFFNSCWVFFYCESRLLWVKINYLWWTCKTSVVSFLFFN